jgi:hypothetical protein
MQRYPRRGVLATRADVGPQRGGEIQARGRRKRVPASPSARESATHDEAASRAVGSTSLRRYTATPMVRAHLLRRALLRGLVALVALGPAAACRVTEAKLWNLREVHRADGGTKYTGRLHSDVEHVLRTMFDVTGFSGGAPPEREAKIDDPLGECLENVIELGGCDQDEPQNLYVTIEAVSWLATDCRYPLSRERCTLELGTLGKRVGLAGPMRSPEPAVGVAEVSKAIEDLTRSVAGAIGSVALGAGDVEETSRAAAGLALDLQGARRLLTVANLLADRLGEGSETARDLEPLRTDLARRCAGFALDAALADRSSRVRAAALRVAVDLEPAAAAARLDAALGDESLEVRVAAVRLLGRSDRPPQGPDGKDADVWTERLVGFLRQSFDGELSVALCKTLARWTGRPRNLHPEAWVEWWEDEGLAAAGRS